MSHHLAPAEIAIIGAGPTASSLLERLAANAAQFLEGRPLRVHLIDPHRTGLGRVWRDDLDPRLWMNSMAEDVTMFTDDSVRCDGPIRPGPSLYEWAQTIDDATLATLAPPPLAAEIRSLGPMTFPTRRVQSAYLDWFHRRVLDDLPEEVEIVAHRRRALDVIDDPDGRQRITLDGDPDPLVVDTVVLALGHLDSAPDAATAVFSDFAVRHGLTHVPPGHTAELDLTALAPGKDVIALGFGQAFTDLLVLVTEGRGGRFVETDGQLRYEPSGLEPVIHVGSGRGVPYRSKMNYRLQGPRAPLPRFLDDDTVEFLIARGSLDFRRDVLPLVVKEVSYAYYHELFVAHPERTSITWERFEEQFVAADPHDDSIGVLVDTAVPDPQLHFDIERIDRPLRGLRFDDSEQLHQHVAGHVAADVARRTDPAFSADLGAFNGLLATFGAIGRLAAAGALTPRSRVEDVGGWWFSFFMYSASGPPPERLRQLLALADAGLVRFIGADTTVAGDAERGVFVATSTSHAEAVRAEVLIDARIAGASLSRTSDALLANLRDRGEAVEEVARDDDGWSCNTGKVEVTGADMRIARADGSADPARHALGTFTSRPAAGAFARPRTNAPSFRQNDLVARSILTSLVSSHTAEVEAVAS
jgi:hypothetical protein